MNDLQKARRPAGGPGDAGTAVRGRALSSAHSLPYGARGVKTFAEQAAQLAVKHSELAAWHRERAARWLESCHMSPWHSRQYFDHVDAAAWHERLAARHAQICASLQGVTDGNG